MTDARQAPLTFPPMQAVKPKNYLYEVQGLRTAAALLVAVYHIWLHRVSGGVDVFFVVSAYFLGYTLLRQPITAYGILSYYASTARRVVPNATLVIAATSLASIVLVPRSDWDKQIDHAFASLLFRENWHLIESNSDYLQRGLSASPFQQMWALSLQGQIYLVFPIVIGIAGLLGRWKKIGPRLAAKILFSALFLVSLYYSISLTRTDQEAAYFNSYARVWEFAAGVLLVLIINRIRISSPLASILCWIGLGAILVMGIVLDVANQFPGFVAAVPVLAACAIIVASTNGAGNWVLASRPFVAFAGMSFAFYLWHWPLLIFLRYYLQSDVVGLWGLAVIAGAGGLAYLSTRFVEAPFRRWGFLEMRPLATLAICAGAIALTALTPWLWQAMYKHALREARSNVLAFAADPTGFQIPAGKLIPDTIVARSDNPPGYKKGTGCHQLTKSPEALTCSFGDTTATKTVALVGGSHSLQWLPAIDLVGKQNGFKVVSITKSTCILVFGNWGSTACQKWNRNVAKVLSELKPELVITIGTRRTDQDGVFNEEVLDGYLEAWRWLDSQGIRVLAIRDNPRFPRDPVNCIDLSFGDWNRCSRPRDGLIARGLPAIEEPNVTFSDFSDVFCGESMCHVVNNGVLIYRDRDHLTKPFALTQSNRVKAAIHMAAPNVVTP